MERMLEITEFFPKYLSNFISTLLFLYMFMLAFFSALFVRLISCNPFVSPNLIFGIAYTG